MNSLVVKGLILLHVYLTGLIVSKSLELLCLHPRYTVIYE